MRFEVRALHNDGRVVSEVIESDDEPGAIRLAAAKGLAVLSAKPSRARGLAGLSGLPGLSFGSRFDVVEFSQELVALLGAGLSLPETLEVMVEKETRADRRRIVQTLRERIFEGRPFSQAVAALPAQFTPLYVATVRAAERSGDLAEALGRYIEYESRLNAVRNRIVASSIYPVALLAIGALVIVFLLGYVVPRFAAIYAESGRDLPWLSQLLIDWGRLINNHGVLLGALALGAIAAIVLLARRAGAALALAAARVPAVGDKLLVYHLARLFRTLGMLLRGGTPIVTALQMVAGLLPPALSQRLGEVTRRVRDGGALSEGMRAAGLTTPVALRMLRVGENSGELALMMDRIASYHDDELSRWVEWFTRLFEPLLMVFIGIVIGGIVILMYLPIFDLAGSLQ